MIYRRATYFADSKMIKTTKKRPAEITSLQKLKTMKQITPNTLR